MIYESRKLTNTVSTDVKCGRCGHSIFLHDSMGCQMDMCGCENTHTRVRSERPVNNEGDPHYLKLLDEMRELHIKKNAGYSGESDDRWANFRLSSSLGVSPVMGVLVRMSDKWIRITNLIRKPSLDKVNESIRDTLMDLAAYSLIAICLLDEEK